MEEWEIQELKNLLDKIDKYEETRGYSGWYVAVNTDDINDVIKLTRKLLDATTH